MNHIFKTRHHPFLGIVIAFMLFFVAAGLILRVADRTLAQQEMNNYAIAYYGMIKSK